MATQQTSISTAILSMRSTPGGENTARIDLFKKLVREEFQREWDITSSWRLKDSPCLYIEYRGHPDDLFACVSRQYAYTLALRGRPRIEARIDVIEEILPLVTLAIMTFKVNKMARGLNVLIRAEIRARIAEARATDTIISE